MRSSHFNLGHPTPRRAKNLRIEGKRSFYFFFSRRTLRSNTNRYFVRLGGNVERFTVFRTTLVQGL